MFLLHSLVQIAFKSKQKLFYAFIDLKQAFDTVWRDGLWQKLVSVNINGKCLHLIKNMYNDIKSCVRVGKTCSNLFPCLNGLRQGENLSPILVSIYLNDLHDFFSNSGECNGVSIPNELNEDYNLFLKMFVLLYADDTVLLGSTADDLQNALDLYENYCNTWKLRVNTMKSKVVVLSKGRQGTLRIIRRQ